MALGTDDRIAEAKRKGMAWVIDALKLSNLKRAGGEMVGPCPRPGCGGDDRFSANLRKGLFQCRICGGKGDEIALVQMVMGLDLPGALTWMVGERQEISAEEQARRDDADRQNRALKDREEAKRRARASAEGRAIWEAGRPAEDSPVRDYLALRGITRALLPVMPARLRYHPDLPYMVSGSGPHDWVEAHRGPAMLAEVQSADGRFGAVHRTWFDLTAQQGKVSITHPVTGKAEKRKKTWGSKQGGAIRLIPGARDNHTMVMGEGIETTLTAAVAGVWPGAHFWAGVDLGNMAGKRERGQGLMFAGRPDLSEDGDAFVPPPAVERLIYLMDGDSDPRTTRAQLEAGLRRAMIRVPGLQAQIVPCPVGKDLNDVLLEGDDP